MSKAFSLVRLLFYQSLMDFKKRNLGTLLGAIWAILSPLTTIALIYFVFTYGLKTGSVGKISFIHWLVPAMLAWLFVSESISVGCPSIVDSSYLVTKIVFPVWVLPLSRVLSAIPVHLILMFLFMLMFISQGGEAVVTWLQLPYYFICAFVLCSVVSFVSSTLYVFTRDISNVVGVGLQIISWATPVFWNPDMLKGTSYEWLLFSPFNYVVQGYRDSLFNKIWFWENPLLSYFFWGGILFLSIFALILFKRARPHFADVLQ